MHTRRWFRGRRIAAVVVAAALVVSAALPGTVAAATAPAKKAATPPKPVAHTLPFISDDYARALAEAKARQLPIFVESWAPW